MRLIHQLFYVQQQIGPKLANLPSNRLYANRLDNSIQHSDGTKSSAWHFASESAFGSKFWKNTSSYVCRIDDEVRHFELQIPISICHLGAFCNKDVRYRKIRWVSDDLPHKCIGPTFDRRGAAMGLK